jgi:hypothetical protein
MLPKMPPYLNAHTPRDPTEIRRQKSLNQNPSQRRSFKNEYLLITIARPTIYLSRVLLTTDGHE